MASDEDLPYTEQSHPLSENIDMASLDEISKVMSMGDEDIFKGWEGSEGICHKLISEKILMVRTLMVDILKDTESNAIILAGCGTSGRLAFSISRKMNTRLKEMNVNPCIDYILAGGDQALFTSMEAPEDNPMIGKQLLQKATQDKVRVLYIGISCGLTASFVAGQLDYCMDNLHKFIPVLIGFNPVEKARNTTEEGWDQSFLQVARKMEKYEREGKAFIINPIIGPEVITGSSRLKGGTATVILLEAIFSHIRAVKESIPSDAIILEEFFGVYKRSLQMLHKGRNDDTIGQIIELASTSLSKDGHIYYIGDEYLGVIGLIDASECPPTFSTPPSRIRGFTRGGYLSLGNKGGDLSLEKEISLDSLTNVLPRLNESDLIVILSKDADLVYIPDMQREYKAVMVNFQTEKEQILSEDGYSHFDVFLNMDLSPCTGTMPTSRDVDMNQALVEIMAKCFCNTVTTGAHIAIGKVFKNYMIDVKVSNNKLFHRAIRIIQRCIPCPEERALGLLLSAIYRTDEVRESHRNRPVSRHIESATGTEQVVPLAIILGITSSTVAEGLEICFSTPILREAIKKCLQERALY